MRLIKIKNSIKKLTLIKTVSRKATTEKGRLRSASFKMRFNAK